MGVPVAIGLDVGTTAVKASLVGLDGAEHGCLSVRTPWEPSPDGPQLDVVALGDLAVGLAGRAADLAVEQGRTVRAVGVTGMAETGALLDGEGRALAPGYAWHHTLGNPDRVQERLGRRRFIRATGRDATISPSIVKMDMLREHGHVFAPGQCWLNVPDYVAYRLCGVRAAELSVSCRTGLVDLRTATWWDDALELLGAGRWLMPGDPVPGGTPLGRVGGEVPASLRGAFVGTGGHDHPTAALAIGAAGHDDLAVSMGTAEAQLRFVAPPVGEGVVERVVALGGSVDWHPLGDRLTVVAALPTGITLERLARLVGCGSTEDRLELSRAALAASGGTTTGGTTTVRADRVTFDSFALTDVDDEATRVAAWRAVAEQLTETARALMAGVCDVVGPWERARAFGGWVRDPLVRRLRAEAFGPRLELVETTEPGTVGAALLAARAAGEITELPSPGRGAQGHPRPAGVGGAGVGPAMVSPGDWRHDEVQPTQEG